MIWVLNVSYRDLRIYGDWCPRNGHMIQYEHGPTRCMSMPLLRAFFTFFENQLVKLHEC